MGHVSSAVISDPFLLLTNNNPIYDCAYKYSLIQLVKCYERTLLRSWTKHCNNI
jgi:hypothetical protein